MTALVGRVAAVLNSNATKAVAVMLFVFAMAIGSNFDLMFKVGWAMLFAIVGSYVWAHGSLVGLRLERETRTGRTQVGDIAEERFALHSTLPFPRLWIEVHDLSDLPGYQASHVVRFHEGWATSVGNPNQRRSHYWRVRTTCWARGQYTLGPVDLEATDPFGLFTARRRAPLTRRIVVYPATPDLPGFGIQAGGLPGGAAARERTHYVTPNVAGIREYAPGDSYNRIHWRSTARTGKLMVKQFEPDPTSDIWIVLDMETRWQAGEGLDSTEEAGVTAAASLAKHFVDRGRAVGLLAYGARHTVVPADRGARQLLKLLDELAVVQADGRMSLAQVLAAESTRFGRNTTLLLVTPSTDDRWVTALTHLRERGIKSAVCLVEASTFGEAESAIYTLAALAAADIPTYLVKRGVPLPEALAGPGRLAETR